VLVTTFLLAYLLRFDFGIPATQMRAVWVQLPYVVLLQFVALAVSGVYSFIWRYIGLAEIWAFARAAFWSAMPVLLLRLGLPERFQDWRVPLSVIVMDTVLAFGGVLAIRVLRRAVFERYEKQQHSGDSGRRKPVILVGAGRAGVLAAKEIQGRGDIDLWVEGFVDDDPQKQRALIQGKKVLGTTRDLPRLCSELELDHVIITMAQVSREKIRRIVDICDRVPIRAQIIPGLYELLDGRVGITRFRELQIEDLLGREPVKLEEDEVESFIRGKTVMVTGAGGSIGAEMVRQVAKYRPERLLLVERAEFVLFETDRELRSKWPEIEIHPLVADVCDSSRMRQIFAQFRPQVVFHAAAHKHVPLVELNVTEGVRNNVLGTWAVGELAGEFGAEAFVFISTDKAVRPASVMGATKRVAELVVQELDRSHDTRYVAVRFGNVLGSTGSVIPIFRQQIVSGGPLTVTHPEMTRYFMTIAEAAQLVVQAGAMGEGGEIFVLDMGEPVRILDLAKDMITLSGLKPYEDVDIVYSGIRPGEKLFEELQTAGEDMAKTRHPKIYIGKVSPYSSDEIQDAMSRLRELVLSGADEELRSYLDRLLPEAQLAG
ncbi:MAG: nucleoside-diphosphate sugar epimerase/dehydratase, partial [Thermoanaerobaculia bacterium]